jgi:CelD/BcsL family acetyltransferase involved in cellulose biosynthesis
MSAVLLKASVGTCDRLSGVRDLSAPLVVERIDSMQSFLGLEREWRQIESASNVPFTRWDWAVAWWTQLRESKLGVKDSLFVRAIRTHSGELVSVAPMLISRRPSVGPLCVRQLQFFGADPNITELRGLLALPSYRSQAYRALLADAREQAEQWDSMLLSSIPSDLELSELADFPGFEWRGQTESHELVLPSTWEEFRATRGRNLKESLRKCYNSLEREGRKFRLEIAELPADVEPALAHFFKFHSARASLSSGVHHHDIFNTPEAHRFLLDVCHRFAARGTLRIFQLRVDERIVAVRIGFVVNDTLYLYYSGFDPELGKYSVMTTAVAEAIKYAIAAGFQRVNLSTGSDVSKTRWDPVPVVVRHALIISPSRRAEVANHLYRGAISAIGRSPALRQAVKFLARRSPVVTRV